MKQLAWVLCVVLSFATGCSDDDSSGEDTETADAGATFSLTLENISGGEISRSSALEAYSSGTEVTLTATPDAGYVFVGWTGDLSGSENPTTIVMDENKTIGAEFAEGGYSVELADTNNGTLAIQPEQDVYAHGTEVTITATPDDGYILSSWSGDLSGRALTNTLEVTANLAIGASFEEGVTIELAAVENGSFAVSPEIASGEGVPWGTELTITATPADGYVVDSVYKMMWVIEPYWSLYVDESFSSPHTVTMVPEEERFLIYGGSLNKYVLGAYFRADDRWPALDETLDVAYAQPGSKVLKYDVYAPQGASGLPLVVIIHGGGWTLNNEDLMRGQARYLAATGRYVVASIDYRLLNDLDDPVPELYMLVEDVFGAIAHLQEHAAEYGADASLLAVTGDSAGGHLAAAATLLSEYIGDGGYDGAIGSEFLPTYLPEGKSAAQVRTEVMDAVLASAPSYGVFDSDTWDAAISPLRNIPNVATRDLPPQHLQVGSADTVVDPEVVEAYYDALVAAGQDAEFVLVEGASHAYFDWKPEEAVLNTFAEYGEPSLDLMIGFFDNTFYPDL